MATVALERVSLIHPLGDQGDRQVQGISTPISNEEWFIEADLHHGSIGDVTLYRNMTYPQKIPPTWKWYAAIPTANIKSYRVAGELHGPGTIPSDEDEPETEAEAPETDAVASAADSKGAGKSHVSVGAAGPRPGEVRS